MNEFFAGILNGINTVIGNYGWSMVIFTLLFKLIIMPLNYKSRKSMRRMSNLQPQMTKLQKKYENDKEKLNQKMSELYRKEGVNPMSGCLPMILSMAILIIMFNAMRMVANNELASQCLELLTTGVQTNESWLWVKNIWMPDSPFHPIIADSSRLRMMSTLCCSSSMPAASCPSSRDTEPSHARYRFSHPCVLTCDSHSF